MERAVFQSQPLTPLGPGPISLTRTTAVAPYRGLCFQTNSHIEAKSTFVKRKLTVLSHYQ